MYMNKRDILRTLLPLLGVHGLVHPLADGWFEESKGDVGTDEGPGAASNVWIH